VRVPVGVVVAAGVGVVGVAGFTFFGIQRNNDVSHLSSCKPNCVTSTTEHENGAPLILTDVSLALALGGLGTAAYLYFSRSERETATTLTAPRVSVAVSPLPGGAQASLAGAF
jgi:hypothetical protein